MNFFVITSDLLLFKINYFYQFQLEIWNLECCSSFALWLAVQTLSTFECKELLVFVALRENCYNEHSVGCHCVLKICNLVIHSKGNVCFVTSDDAGWAVGLR